MKEDMTTIWVRRKDVEYLEKIRDKKGHRGLGVAFEKLIETFKRCLSMEEIK